MQVVVDAVAIPRSLLEVVETPLAGGVARAASRFGVAVTRLVLGPASLAIRLWHSILSSFGDKNVVVFNVPFCHALKLDGHGGKYSSIMAFEHAENPETVTVFHSTV